MIYHIINRSFIVLSNIGAFDFLQSMCTCDLNRIKTHGTVWGAILSPQGKILYGFYAFMYKNSLYMDVKSDILMDCGKYLSKYALNTHTDFAIGQNINVYAIWGDDAVPDIKTAYIDPRHNNMGHRVYVFDNAVTLTANANDTEYHKMRIIQNIPDLDTDIPITKAFALECNMDIYNGVSFEKDCYIGQEVTARMHWRKALKKRLIPIGDGGLQVGEKLKTADNKPSGEISFVCGNMAMAMVRIGTTPDHTENNTAITILPHNFPDVD